MESFQASQVADWCVYGLPAFQDNYLWAIVHEPSKRCVVVDPGCAKTVRSFIEAHRFHLSGILVTHHHSDHVGGLKDLQTMPQLPVYGPDNPDIPAINRVVDQNQQPELIGLDFKVLEVPGHTLDHIAYVTTVTSNDGTIHTWLFCGDTLFAGGCGRLFEGTHEQMFHSLQKINQLPAQTLVFCAHEYTQANYRFAHHFATNNIAVLQRKNEVDEIRKNADSTVPTTLQTERLSNLFLNAKNVQEFKTVRQAKDQF